MKKVTVMHLFTISVYLVLGIIIGIVVIKDWLTHEQMQFIQQLKDENSYFDTRKASMGPLCGR
ncbi:hypothetical protein KHA80_02685 [Anaerobacillus sp. HL2]|nr:hypothetical protein KHA80_02685 [Anaerobacillus sp. HL2]